MDHGEDEFFDFMGLYFCLGEELGGSQAKPGHLSIGHLAAGVNH
jgi:hypothetical protein